MKIQIKTKNRKISLNVRKCCFFGRFRGLMFRNREKSEALLFELNKKKRLSLHSFFVFFPFLVLWLDDKNSVLDSRKCRPFEFRINSEKKFSRIIEIPLNNKNKQIWKLLVGD